MTLLKTATLIEKAAIEYLNSTDRKHYSMDHRKEIAYDIANALGLNVDHFIKLMCFNNTYEVRRYNSKV